MSVTASVTVTAQLAGTATMPASMAILFKVYDRRDRVKAMGWMSVVIAGAPSRTAARPFA